MWSNDTFQQRLAPKTKENQKNPEQSDLNRIERKPGLLKRVGRWLIRIAEIPLHVVGGALDATGHLLHGRLDKSVQSLAGGIHAGIHEIPLLGDVIKKIERTTPRIHEKIKFNEKDDWDIKDAENTLRKTVGWLLSKYDGKSNEEIKKEAEELRKKIQEEFKKEAKNVKFSQDFDEKDYSEAKKEIPGIPDFNQLNSNQREILQVMYFWRGKSPDLKNPKIQQYFQKLITASWDKSTRENQLDLAIFSTKNMPELQELIHFTPLERVSMDYTLNLTERVRRIQTRNEPKSELLDDTDLKFMWWMDNKLTQLFGEVYGVSGWH